MKHQKSYMKARIIAYTIAFGVPVLLMMNCTGWNAGRGEVSSCFLDGYIFKEIANFLYTVVFFSAFALLLPILLYMGLIIAFVEITIKDLKKETKIEENMDEE